MRFLKSLQNNGFYIEKSRFLGCCFEVFSPKNLLLLTEEFFVTLKMPTKGSEWDFEEKFSEKLLNHEMFDRLKKLNGCANGKCLVNLRL